MAMYAQTFSHRRQITQKLRMCSQDSRFLYIDLYVYICCALYFELEFIYTRQVQGQQGAYNILPITNFSSPRAPPHQYIPDALSALPCLACTKIASVFISSFLSQINAFLFHLSFSYTIYVSSLLLLLFQLLTLIPKRGIRSRSSSSSLSFATSNLFYDEIFIVIIKIIIIIFFRFLFFSMSVSQIYWIHLQHPSSSSASSFK